MKKMFAFIGALCLLFVAGQAFAQQKVSQDNMVRAKDYDSEKQHQMQNYKYDLNDPAEIAKAAEYENKIIKAMQVDGFKPIPNFVYTDGGQADRIAYAHAKDQLKVQNWALYRSLFIEGSN